MIWLDFSWQHFCWWLSYCFFKFKDDLSWSSCTFAHQLWQIWSICIFPFSTLLQLKQSSRARARFRHVSTCSLRRPLPFLFLVLSEQTSAWHRINDSLLLEKKTRVVWPGTTVSASFSDPISFCYSSHCLSTMINRTLLRDWNCEHH